MITKSSRLVVLMYHRVLTAPDPYRADDITVSQFAKCMTVIKRLFNVLPLGEAVERLKSNSLPARTLAITFDDGYEDNFSVAAPVLSKLRLPATVFVSTGFLDGGRMWNDTVIETIRILDSTSTSIDGLGCMPLSDLSERQRAVKKIIDFLKHQPFDERQRLVDQFSEPVANKLPRDLMMRRSQVAKLHSYGIDVGAHTVQHPILATLPVNLSEKEIVDSKTELESIVDKEINCFAYPNGRPGRDYRPEDVELVRQAGFKFAVSTAWGSVGPESDRFQLPRIGPWDRSGLKLALRVFRTYASINASVAV